MNLSRRRLLSVIGLAGLAGCGGDAPAGEADTTTTRTTAEPDLSTRSVNETGAPQTAATPSATPPTPVAGERVEKLVAQDGEATDWFGSAVALSTDGTTALVGAPNDEGPEDTNAGSAYAFERGDGGWTQRAKLVPEDREPKDTFGDSAAVSADGTVALFGAPREEAPAAEGAGAAYVFERTGGSWTERAKLAAGGTEDEHDRFGSSLSLSADGTTALVGARQRDTDAGVGAGAASVFSRAGGDWTRSATLAPADADSWDGFGSTAALSRDGTTAVVGAPKDEDPNGEAAGSAYVFERESGAWRERAKLVPSTGDESDDFGSTVTMSADGTTVLVGAPDDADPNGFFAGAAYVFERAGGSWGRQTRIAPADGSLEAGFGAGAALSDAGTVAVVGAAYDPEPNGEHAGSAYVFERTGGTWTERTKFAPADGDEEDWFGEFVAVSGDGTTALLSARRDEDPHGHHGGSVYVYE